MSTQMFPMHSPEHRESPGSVAPPPMRYLCFGAFHLDLIKDDFYKDGARVKLQGKVYQALIALLQKPGQIVTREELRMHLWPSDTHVNYDANVNTTVNKLRQVLSDSPEQPVFVETIPRKGYSFVGKIEYADRPPAPPAPKSEPEPVGLTPIEGAAEPVESKASFFRNALLSRWFTVGVVAVVIVSMLFGAALVLYAHR